MYKPRSSSDATTGPDRNATSTVGKTTLTAPGGPTTAPGVGKSPLTASAPVATSTATSTASAASASASQPQDVDAAAQELQDAQLQVQRANDEIARLRAQRASARKPSDDDRDTASLAELDDYLSEVQVFQARVVHLQQVKPKLLPATPAAAPASRAPSPPPRVPSPQPPAAEQHDDAAAPAPADTAVAPAAGKAFDYDWLKRAAKASSYGLALAGQAASFIGWSALYHVPRVQQIGQVSGSIGKNFVGAVGDYADHRDKSGKGENADGLLLKSGGQAISGVGQVLNLAGMVAANGTVVRATGAFVNALGMVVSGVGELQPAGAKKNVAKASANFIAAVFAALGGIGFAVDQATVGQVADEVARSLDATASASSAFSPFGGAVDDAKNSKAAGDTKRERLLNDPKPGGQAISAIGGVMNTAALILNKVADHQESPAEAMKLRTAARVLGSLGGMLASVGNGFTAVGEWHPAKAPPKPDAEQGTELATLGPTPAV